MAKNRWIKRYTPPQPSYWQGRHDGPRPSRFHEIVRYCDLNKEELPQSLGKKLFAFVGFACDAGIKRNHGRLGAKEGPEALRQELAKLPTHLKNPYEIYDLGDIHCNDNNLEEAQSCLADVIALALKHGMHPIVLGGGHEVAWGHFQGIQRANPNTECAIVNFDAHFDLRPLLEKEMGSSGTPFLQIAQSQRNQERPFNYTCLGIQPLGNTQALFERAKELNVNIILSDEFHTTDLQNTKKLLKRIIEQNKHIYLTICLDVFAAPFAPGVSAPQPLGLCPWHVIPFLKQLASSGKVLSMDIAELCPALDEDGRTAKLAAMLLSHYLHAL